MMSKWISADSVINKLNSNTGFTTCADVKRAIKLIQDEPGVDIVFCKECKYWIGETEHYEDREYKACWQLCGQYMNSEFWCKYGEREGE